jgi:predicted RecB family nuclease
MFTQADRAIFSATDLINYLGCRHATFLDLISPRRPLIEAQPDPTQELLKKKGLEHERRHLECLRNQGKRVVLIDPYSTIQQRVEQTTTAMAEGADVIYQGALLDIPWMGYADFLLRVNGETRLGPYGYEVIDTKLGRTAQPKHVIQLCVYSRLLSLVQDRLPQNIHVVLGSTQVSMPLSQFLYYAELAQRRLQHFAANPPQQSFGVPCGHCAYCRWIELCSAEWDRVDHLSLVANITRHQIAKLQDAGIKTLRNLSELAIGAVIPKMPIETLSRLRQHAQLQIGKRDTGKDSWELVAAPPGKGFARMPKPDVGDLFFDMEGDPLADDGLEYLFGFAYRDDGQYKFKSFWAHSRTEEKRAFEYAIDFMIERLAKFPDTHIYHYASYEESAIKRLSVLHGTREDQIDDLLRQRKLVDLYKVVREAVRISESRYSLKNIETFYMAGRTDEVSAAGDSIVAYEQWRELGDPALLKQIEDYNATDCRSTLLLRDWLLSLRPKDTPWFVTNAGQEEKSARSTTLSEAEARRQNTTALSLEGVSAQVRPYRELISQLLEFYRREAKPLWWARYNWQDSSEEELDRRSRMHRRIARDSWATPDAR